MRTEMRTNRMGQTRRRMPTGLGALLLLLVLASFAVFAVACGEDPTATPQPTATAPPQPAPTATPAPEPTATAAPEPTATPAPQPTATPALEPTATTAPQPTATPAPEPAATPAPEPEPAPDDDALTRAYVTKAVEYYEANGRDATVAYYNDPASREGERVMTIIDPAAGLILASGISPVAAGMSMQTAGSVFPSLDGVSEEGMWLEHQGFNPVTSQQGPQRSFAVRHDGLIFVSGHFILRENLAGATKNYVNKAIELYQSEGLDATIAHYNSRDSLDGQFYLFLIDEDDLYLAHPIFPHLIGTDIKDRVSSDGYELGKEIAKATEDGHWVEYLWPHPVTGREGLKVAWVVRHDGLIFASGYYEGEDDSGPPPWQDADPEQYTVDYVNRAIDRYRRDGLDAMTHYYNSVASFEGQWYLFATGADNIYTIHPLIPRLIGTDITEVVGSDGYELGKEIAKATGEGIWVEYLWPHPVNGEEVPKVAYAKRHDGMIFASGYYPDPEVDPIAYTKAHVQKAIDRYESDGLDATVAYYSTPESFDGQWVLSITDKDGNFLAVPLAPGMVGASIKTTMIALDGQAVGARIAEATEEGFWVSFPWGTADTAEVLTLHMWVIRYDGLIFMSGFYTDQPTMPTQ